MGGSSAESLLGKWLTATGAVYALGAADFVARPWAATGALSRSGGEPLEAEEPGVYHALAAAYMATIAALALAAGREPEARAHLVPPLLVAKAVSSAALFYRYRRTGKKGYALASGLDAFLFGITGGLHAAADR